MQQQYPGGPYWQGHGPQPGWQQFPPAEYGYRYVMLPRYVEFIAEADTAKNLRRTVARRLALSRAFWAFTLAFPLFVMASGIIRELTGSEETDWSVVFGAYLVLLVPCLVGFFIGCCVLAIRGDETSKTTVYPEAHLSIRYGHSSMDVHTPAAWNTLAYTDVRSVEVYRHAVYINVRNNGLLLPRQLMPDDLLPLFKRKKWPR
ncbi:hypothetical protein ACFO5K_25890 [Nocardia halotolerans]|uniref:YcxB-like protein domain-containing protein n=1 Tax=Nocardia halotolerans TaxID=1755878 RepID=A0ABV8VN79_9NOCA